MAESKEPDLLWTYEDVADYLSMSRSTVERMKRRGELPTPVFDQHKYVRWRERDIVAWREKKIAVNSRHEPKSVA